MHTRKCWIKFLCRKRFCFSQLAIDIHDSLFSHRTWMGMWRQIFFASKGQINTRYKLKFRVSFFWTIADLIVKKLLFHEFLAQFDLNWNSIHKFDIRYFDTYMRFYLNKKFYASWQRNWRKASWKRSRTSIIVFIYAW